jgi:hypothetical protein
MRFLFLESILGFSDCIARKLPAKQAKRKAGKAGKAGKARQER